MTGPGSRNLWHDVDEYGIVKQPRLVAVCGRERLVFVGYGEPARVIVRGVRGQLASLHLDGKRRVLPPIKEGHPWRHPGQSTAVVAHCRTHSAGHRIDTSKLRDQLTATATARRARVEISAIECD